MPLTYSTAYTQTVTLLFKLSASAMTLGLLLAGAPPLGSVLFGYPMGQKLWVLSGIGGAIMLCAGSIVAAAELSRRL